MTTKLVLWVISDGKKGHEKQTTGLVQAIDELTSRRVATHRILTGTPLRTLKNLAKPQLVIGAGNATHLPMVMIKAIFNVPCVLLMKPSLPTFLFDLVFVPHHDSCSNFGNVHTTLGVLSPVPSVQPDAHLGVVLLGGVSRHFHWDSKSVTVSVESVCAANPNKHWIICDSPRSPRGLLERLENIPNGTTRHWRTTNNTFLTNLLSLSSETWVSCDSVSMLYEALNTGTPVGVIELPSKRRRNKLARGIKELATNKHVHLTGMGYSIDNALVKTPPGEEVRHCAKICLQLLRDEFVS